MPCLPLLKTFARLTLFALALTNLALASNNTAMADTNTQSDALPEAIEHLQNKGLVIKNSFWLGNSLKGWVVSFAGQEQVIYTTADGEFLINGVVLDAQGNDLTSQHQKAWLSQVTWQDLNEAHFVSNVSNNPTNEQPTQVIYVFFDANCPFCKLAWLALQPYVQVGLEVRWLPVAYLQPSSKHKAAALLNSAKEEQPQLLAQLLAANPTEEENNSYTPENLNQLEANTQLMQSLGLNATPAWVWLNETGELESFAGMLRLPKIAEITGLPKQKHPEASLTRFR